MGGNDPLLASRRYGETFDMSGSRSYWYDAVSDAHCKYNNSIVITHMAVRHVLARPPNGAIDGHIHM